MSSSGLIYMAILGAWAVYLVSRCLRSPGGQPDTHSQPADGAVLRRRGSKRSAAAARPRASADLEPVVKRRQADLGPGGGRPLDVPVVVTAVPQRKPVSRATARRRRRLILLLLVSVAVVSAVTAAGYLAVWAPGIPGLMLVTYLVELRAQARRAQAPHVRVVAKPPVVVHTEAAQVGRVRKALRIPAEVPFVDPWPVFEDVEPVPATKKSVSWEPVPVPVPTYVTAPKASDAVRAAGVPVAVRRIDVSAGRVWVNSATDDTQEIPVALTKAADPPLDGETEVAPAGVAAETTADAAAPVEADELPRKRAVNE